MKRMFNNSRVYISGTGVISPNGIGLTEFWNNVKNGVSGIKRIDFFDTDQNKVKIAGYVQNLDKLQFSHNISDGLYDRVSILIKIAADEALKSSNLHLDKIPDSRVGIVFGLGMSGMQSLEAWYKDFFIEKTGMTIDAFIASFPNTPSAIIAMEYGIRGLNYTINTACSSSGAAIGLAFLLIKMGMIDVCLTGGADAPLTQATLKNFESLKVLNSKSNDQPEKASKPFSKDRKGFVLSEGAGVLILESEEHLEERNGTKECEVIGYGASNDAFHIVAPSENGQMLAVESALRSARINPREVDYIHAHGTGTKRNDLIETQVIKNIYNKNAYNIPISSVKSMIGHPIGASAALSTICTIQALKNNYLPPTINLELPDPECDLDYCANKGRSREVKTAVVNSFGFGGNNNVLVLKHAD